jgi:hypothetical protein
LAQQLHQLWVGEEPLLAHRQLAQNAQVSQVSQVMQVARSALAVGDAFVTASDT